MVEFMVAMVILGVAMAGIYPLLIVQSKAVESLELRYTEKGAGINQSKSWFSPVRRSDLGEERILRGDDEEEGRENYGIWYLKPAEYELPSGATVQDAWARKIGAPAMMEKRDTPLPSLMETTLLLDDGDVDFSSGEGEWSPQSTGYNGNSQYSEEPIGTTKTATWAYDITNCNIPPGYYHIYATWPVIEDAPPTSEPEPGPDNASFIIDGNDPKPVKQYVLPPDDYPNDEDQLWQKLTDVPICVDQYDTEVTVKVISNSYQVDEETRYYPVVGDAVRLVPVNIITVQSVERNISKPGEAEKTVVKVKVESN